MNKQLFTLLALAGTLFLCSSSNAYGQYVGIGEANPNSKVDAVHTGATGNSLELTHSNTGNISSAAWIKNGGIGRGLNIQSLNTGNINPGIQVTQYGIGSTSRGIDIDMDATTNAFGLAVFQDGSYDAIYTNSTAAGYGIFNVIDGSGGAIYNLKNGTGAVSTVDDLSASAGGIGHYINFSGAVGSGLVVDDIGGDGFGVFATVTTATPTVSNIVSGAVVAGSQSGIGHGILINHHGLAGRGAEFNITNTANTDPALFITHAGGTNVAVIQNQCNAIGGTIAVVDAAYTGTDQGNHIGVFGSSAPGPSLGVGVRGNGNYAGIVGMGGNYGVISFGDFAATGAKLFLIDHPHDPENKYLRHFAIESNEVMNIYRGTVSLDGNGQAQISLPDYFEDVNTDFSYQLTAIGTSVQPFVKTEIANNEFAIAGDPNTKVSWMVMATRNDLQIRTHPDKYTDVYEKADGRKGKYLQPELYGASEAKGIMTNEINRPNRQITEMGAIEGQEEIRILRKEALRKAAATKAANRTENNAPGQ